MSYIGDSVGPSLNYTYNLKNQVDAVTSPGYTFFNRNFTYDGNGRLATATGPWGSATYSYDTLGNITKKAEGTRVVDLQYNATTNRISNVKDTAAGNAWRSYSHDASGNVTADGRHTFVYDMANQPISMTGEASGTFVYDGNKKRVKQLVDGETIYSFYSQAGPLVGTYNLTTNEYTDYIAAAGQTLVRVKNGVVTYPINDLLGTAIATVSATGTLLNDSIYNYTPWGEIHDSVPFAASGRRPAQQNLQGFTGHIEDKSGLVYMQARYYDPVIGRFLSTDPVDYADQLNLYAYVGNDPVNFIDPTGQTMEVVGSDEFKEEIEKQLENLRETKEGEKLLRQIEESKNHFTIKEGFRESKANPNNSQNAVNGEGTGGEIKHDPANEPMQETVAGREPAPPEVVLGHEFSHAVDFDNGRHDETISNVTGNKRGEDRAVIRENKIRSEMGIPRRIQMNLKRILVLMAISTTIGGCFWADTYSSKAFDYEAAIYNVSSLSSRHADTLRECLGRWDYKKDLREQLYISFLKDVRSGEAAMVVEFGGSSTVQYDYIYFKW